MVVDFCLPVCLFVFSLVVDAFSADYSGSGRERGVKKGKGGEE